MLINDRPEIHSVELITAQDQEVTALIRGKMEQILADGVGCALVPGAAGEGLLGSQNLHETIGELIEFIGLGNMAMERSRVELRQQVNLAYVRIDTVGDRDIDQPVLTGQRDRRLGALLSEREKSRALAPTHNDRQDFSLMISRR